MGRAAELCLPAGFTIGCTECRGGTDLTEASLNSRCVQIFYTVYAHSHGKKSSQRIQILLEFKRQLNVTARSRTSRIHNHIFKLSCVFFKGYVNLRLTSRAAVSAEAVEFVLFLAVCSNTRSY